MQLSETIATRMDRGAVPLSIDTSRQDDRNSRVPLWSAFLLAAGVATLAPATRPLSDPDIWWHIRLGRSILANHALPHIDTWSFTAAGQPWRPTAWLSDVVIGGTYNAFGYRGIIVLKVLFSAMVLWVLARTLLKESEPRVAALVFAPAALTLSVFLGERPQLASFLFVLWIGSECRRTLSGSTVNVAKFAVLIWLWANVHGMWFLGPAFLAAAAVLKRLDPDSPGRRTTLHNVSAAVAGLVAAALTPVGPRLVIQPLLVIRAAHRITEWERTVLWQPAFFGYVALVVILVYAWARSPDRVARSEVLWGAAVLVFSLMAARNVAPATLLLAPLAARALGRIGAFATAESLAPRRLLVVIGGIGLCLIAALTATNRSVSTSEPKHLVDTMLTMSGHRSVRVVNDYDVGGYLVGTTPYVKVAIDGRTDTYGADFVDRYFTMTAMEGSSWRATWKQLAGRGIDYAVLDARSAFAEVIQHDYHWRAIAQDGRWLLLAPPATSTS